MRRPTVLIVDPERPIRYGFGKILKMYGYRALTAETMSEATQLILKHDVDLVVTEDQLADGDGLELCRQMKLGRLHALPFILWAGHEISTDKLNRAGIDLFAGSPSIFLRCSGTLSDL